MSILLWHAQNEILHFIRMNDDWMAMESWRKRWMSVAFQSTFSRLFGRYISVNGLFDGKNTTSIAALTWDLEKYTYHLFIESVIYGWDALIYVANVLILFLLRTYFLKAEHSILKNASLFRPHERRSLVL